LEIELNLAKATYESVEPHGSFQGANYIYDYNKTLSSYALDANYYWKNPDEVPTCSKTDYEAYYNKDKVNYENKDLSVYIKLGKATYPNEKSEAIINIKFGGFESDFTLYYLEENMPEGYMGYRFNMQELETKSTYLLPNEVGYFFNNCIYNYDLDNYYDLSATITIFVAKGDYNGITHDAFNGTYHKDQKLSDFILNENYSWKHPNKMPTCDVKSYLAIFSDSDNADKFNDYEFYIDINLAKGNYQLADAIHSLFTGTYSPDQNLSKFALENGYAWANSEIVPTVDKPAYQAIYNGDKVNYNDFYLDITINLGKATYDISGITLPSKTVVYDGKQHYLEYQGALPKGINFVGYDKNIGYIKSGAYPIGIVFSQEDSINYKKIINNIQGILTIEKAPSIIIANDRQSFAYDGTKKSIIARVDNTEQKVNFSTENNFKEKGSYAIVLSTTESVNYLVGQKEVKVFINSTVRGFGTPAAKDTKKVGAVSFGKIENKSGIESDVEAVMEYEDIENCNMPYKDNCLAVLKVNLLLDGENYDYKDEDYTLTVLLPKELRRKAFAVNYFDENGALVSVNSSKNGDCIVIKTQKLGYFVIEEIDEPLTLWAWVLIALATTLTLGTGIYILYRVKDKIFNKSNQNDDIIEYVSEKLENLNNVKEENE
jgi:hypothetical protein